MHLEHGDLINRNDKQYRLWRKLTKNRLLFGLIDILPSRLLLRLAESLERKLRSTNLRYKQNYPEAEVKTVLYAEVHAQIFTNASLQSHGAVIHD